MADSQKVGSSVLVGLMAFVAVSAWVALEVVPDAIYKPVRVFEPQPTQARLIPASESLSPTEALVAAEEAAAAPAPERAVSTTPVVPEQPRERKAAPVKRIAAKAPQPAPRQSVSRALIAARSPAPQPTISTSRAAILVEQRRLTLDERIEMEVMDRLAANPRLSGRIGVQSRNAVVRLTGWTRTVGQARRAERDVRSIRSVRYVQNEIRPRVGGSV